MKGNLKTYIVEWDDSAACNGWRPIEKMRAETPATCVTAGFLVEKSAKKVVLSLSHDYGGGHVAETLVIPRENVKSCRRLYTK